MKARLTRAWFVALASAWVSAEVVGLSLIPLSLMREPPRGLVYLLTSLNLAALVVLIAIGAALLHRSWASIQAHDAPLRPGAAVGLMFIPLFNLYWQFRAFHGFAVEFNRVLDRTSVPAPRIPARLTLAYCIAVCASLPVQFVPVLGPITGLATAVLGIAVVWHVVESISAFEDSQIDIDDVRDVPVVPS